MHSADAVFLGRVLAIEPVREQREPSGGIRFLSHYRNIRLEVLAAWKGAESREMVVHTGMGGGDCGYTFREQGVYLVYAHMLSDSDTLVVGICSRTRPIDDADEDRTALGLPAIDHLHGVPWAAFKMPAYCPVHRADRLRRPGAWLLARVSPDALAQWAVVSSQLPYAGMEVFGGKGHFEPGRIKAPPPGPVCPACREAALEWCEAHGVLGDGEERPEAPDSTTPEARATGARTRALDNAAYRAAHPRVNFAFHYDDGRRLRVDTIEGKLSRLFVSFDDTTVGVSLADTALARVYDAMIEARFWGLSGEHPAYPALPEDVMPGARVRVSLYARSDTLVTALEWRAARLPAHVADAGGDWAGIGRAIEAIESVVRASPEWRALPARPGD
jgi:hypothetical protein